MPSATPSQTVSPAPPDRDQPDPASGNFQYAEVFASVPDDSQALRASQPTYHVGFVRSHGSSWNAFFVIGGCGSSDRQVSPSPVCRVTSEID